MRALILGILGILFSACGGASTVSAPPPWGTEAKGLVAGGCSAVGDAEKGSRRLEVNIQVEHGDVWVVVGDNRLHTTTTQCFAVDVPEATYPVNIRAKGESGAGGVGFGVDIAAREQSGPALRGFSVHCGAPGFCERQAMHDWKHTVESDRRQLGDPCAAAQPKGVTWKGGATSDGVHIQDVEVDFSLRVGMSVNDLCGAQ